MKYSLERSYEILDRTPVVLQDLLSGLPDDWVMPNEGPETFSPYDVIGHLVHGEKTDWTVRTKMILEFGNTKTFEKYDRFAQYEESKGKSLQQLLDEFAAIRKENMVWFKSLNLTEDDLNRQGMHPVLGSVTLRHLLATWVVHDLTHIAQITRVMAKQYKTEMGPWTEFSGYLIFKLYTCNQKQQLLTSTYQKFHPKDRKR
ncbi:MAG: DinB family protein [Chitinophagaceae bacterium]|nr:DinB family protein [Chitinophagaceae bacterium]